jgi:hypothetical protein
VVVGNQWATIAWFGIHGRLQVDQRSTENGQLVTREFGEYTTARIMNFSTSCAIPDRNPPAGFSRNVAFLRAVGTQTPGTR